MVGSVKERNGFEVATHLLMDSNNHLQPGFTDHKDELIPYNRSGYTWNELLDEEKWKVIVEEYIREEDLNRLTILLQEHSDLLKYITYEEAETCLHIACRHQHYEIVKLIVEMLPNREKGQPSKFGTKMINSPTREGLTPLHYVARFCQIGSLSKGFSPVISTDNWEDEMSEEAYRIVELLIEHGASVIARDKHGMEPLHYAAMKGSTAVTHALLKANIIRDIDPIDLVGLTPLMTACAHGSAKVLQILLKKKASIEFVDKIGNSVLHLAAEHGHVEILETLLQENPDTIKRILRDPRKPKLVDWQFYDTKAQDTNEKTPLHLAVEKNHLYIVIRMLTLITESTDGKVHKFYGNEKEIPITAARRGFLEVLKNLHSFGFPLTVSNEAGETPLHVAASSNHHDTVKYLLDTIEDDDILERKDGKGMTPLLRAACGRNQEAAKVLLDEGADYEATDNQGRSLVYLAAENNNPNFLKWILETLRKESGSEMIKRRESSKSLGPRPRFKLSDQQKFNDFCRLIDSSNKLGWTGLHVAASNGYLEICELLKGYHASVDELNSENETALHLAAKNGHLSVVKFYLNWFNELTAGKTPLKVVMRQNSVTSMDERLWLKCFIKAIDNTGNTALHLAAKNGHSEVCIALLKNEAEINTTNLHKRTPLDLACEFGHLDCVKVLVDHGSDVNGVKFLSKYPLLMAAGNGQHKVVEYLLARPNIVIDAIDIDESIEDNRKEQMNALEMALDGGHVEMARALLGHKDWEKLMQRSNTMMRTKFNAYERKTPMRTMIKKYPNLALQVMDQCITETNAEYWNQQATRTYKFEFIEDTFMVPSTRDSDELVIVNEFGKRWYDENWSVRPEAQPYNKNLDVLYREHPLMLMVGSTDSEDNPLLEHELVDTLLAQKWNRLGRYVYYITTLVYLLFLLSFTVFLSIIPPGYNVHLTNDDQSRTLWEEMDSNQLNKTHDQWIELCGKQVDTYYTRLAKSLKWLIIVLAAAQLIKELVQMFCRRLAYFSIENIVELFIYISVLVVMYDFSLCTSLIGIREPWQWQLACISAFLAWINLLLFIRKLPRLGIFILMFSNVLKTFLRFAIIFILFNLAFSITFYLLMQNRAEFSTIPRSVLKSLAMQIGELDFSAIFYGDSPEDHSKKVYTEWLAYPLFLVFCVVMTILLMNLLVGLAVDNINDVQKKAEIRRIRMNVELVLEIERSMPFLKRHCIKPFHQIFLSEQNRGLYKLVASYLGPAALRNSTKNPFVSETEEDDMKKLRTELIEQKRLLRELQESLIGFKRSFDSFASEKQRIES